MAPLYLDHREIAGILLDIQTGLRTLVTLGETLDDPQHEVAVGICRLLRPMLDQLSTVQETLSSYWIFLDDGLEVPHGLDVV